MVVDIAQERLTANLPTGGQIYDFAIDPRGRRLFLAMGQLGLKRLSLPSGSLTQITDRVCPIYVAIDHQGKRLYVAYQCLGRSGRPGHDSLEIFDADPETSLGIVNGRPMVGGPTIISLDDRLALLDGGDACSSPAYDHAGCLSVPSHVFISCGKPTAGFFTHLTIPWKARVGASLITRDSSCRAILFR